MTPEWDTWLSLDQDTQKVSHENRKYQRVLDQGNSKVSHRKHAQKIPQRETWKAWAHDTLKASQYENAWMFSDQDT